MKNLLQTAQNQEYGLINLLTAWTALLRQLKDENAHIWDGESSHFAGAISTDN